MSYWKDIEGFKGLYQINPMGTVRSFAYGYPKVMKPHRMKVGYMAITFGGRPRYLHRLLAEAFIPNPDGKLYINHKDGDKTNNRLENLEWCTHQENMQHAQRTGLVPPSNIGPGEKSPAAKLTDSKVRSIKDMLAHGYSHQFIADMFGVAKGTIGWIKRGKTWAHI